MNIYQDAENYRCEEEFPLVAREHDRQIEKWGYQRRSLFEWITYLTEEVGELAEAVSNIEYDSQSKDASIMRGDAIKEAHQVAALATRMAAIIRLNVKEASHANDK